MEIFVSLLFALISLYISPTNHINSIDFSNSTGDFVYNNEENNRQLKNKVSKDRIIQNKLVEYKQKVLKDPFVKCILFNKCPKNKLVEYKQKVLKDPFIRCILFKICSKNIEKISEIK